MRNIIEYDQLDSNFKILTDKEKLNNKNKQIFM